MPELLAHLVGDYVLQTHKMAVRKTSSTLWAVVHAFFYTLPFLLLTQAPLALAVIFGTHAVIDRLALARRFCEFYGCGGFNGRVWHDDAYTEPPTFLKVWLVIIVDNTAHLAINHFVLTCSLTLP